MDQKSGTGRQGDIRKPQSSSRQEWEFSLVIKNRVIWKQDGTLSLNRQWYLELEYTG